MRFVKFLLSKCTSKSYWNHRIGFVETLFSCKNMDGQNIKICFYIVTALFVVAGTSFFTKCKHEVVASTTYFTISCQTYSHLELLYCENSSFQKKAYIRHQRGLIQHFPLMVVCKNCHSSHYNSLLI